MSFALTEIASQLSINLKNNVSMAKVQAKLKQLIKTVSNQVRTYDWTNEQGQLIHVRSPHSISCLLQLYVLFGKQPDAKQLLMLKGLRNRAESFFGQNEPHKLLQSLIQYADQLFPRPEQYSDGLEEEETED
jgi:hypothetical protein